MPLSRLMCSLNPFEPSASTRFPHRCTPQPSTAKLECPSSPNAKFRTPRELFPYPKISEPRKRIRRGKKSTILTSTSNKEELENEESKKKEAQRKKEFEQRKNELRGKRYQ
ncbi:hypothetical protein HHI36_003201 [Cryptolaemus montrouzieri]|uniref:Uncharacterized protein n=1 Tax=Cryptolaemus montrouzieri TaxID=559131 RepID=A0ABD2PD78_9CUCU